MSENKELENAPNNLLVIKTFLEELSNYKLVEYLEGWGTKSYRLVKKDKNDE